MNKETAMSEEKLPPKFKAKWVAALRSGEYRQGKRYLRSFSCYCCLGVAAKVAGYSDDSLSNCGSLAWGQFDRVPEMLRGDMCSGSVASKLAYMNDTGSTFAEIADYIEANF